MPIRVLASDIAARIAAGEVVERPASVVKELVENALDAGASRVAVEITGGGLDSIRVTDDGCGIDPAELATAFERHATSKLSDDADLVRVQTLGFRGEALPSIAAVGEVEITSRPPSQEAAAWVKLVPDAAREEGARGAPVGTAVSVRRLFGRLPARRKFLRTPGNETTAIASVVTHCALSCPEVRFSLAVDGRQSFATPGSGDLRDAVAAVYGLDTAAEMLTVAPGDGPLRVSGLIGPPHVSRASRGYVSLFVNRRWVQNRRLSYAVQEAYQGMLMTGRFPVAVLNIAAQYEDVDVNVHPTKAEVRFVDESAAFGAVQRSVRAALVANSPVPVGAAMTAPGGAGLALAPQPWTPPLWERGLRHASTSAALAPAAAPPREAGMTPAETLPVLRVIGQFGNIYIIAEGPEGMYLIDQHAAHERVLYERFCAAREGLRPDVQGLLEPVAVDVSPRVRELLGAESRALAGHGFGIEAFGEAAVLVRALPAALARGDVSENVRRFLDVLAEEEEGDRRDRVAMSLACHGAIRAGKQLTPEEMRELVLQLEAAASPHTCPHGRPTIVHMSAEALARGFGRR